MSDSEVSDSGSANKRKKKGLSKSETIKKAKVKGTSHVNYAGKVVPARKTGLPCR